MNSFDVDVQFSCIAHYYPTLLTQLFISLQHVNFQLPVCCKCFATKFAFLWVSLVVFWQIQKRAEANVTQLTVVLPNSLFIKETGLVSLQISIIRKWLLTIFTQELGGDLPSYAIVAALLCNILPSKSRKHDKLSCGDSDGISWRKIVYNVHIHVRSSYQCEWP